MSDEMRLIWNVQIMRKLTRSNKISEISVIWSAVLVSFDQAARRLGWAGIVFALSWYGKLPYTGRRPRPAQFEHCPVAL
jgi:hypothetical protein